MKDSIRSKLNQSFVENHENVSEDEAEKLIVQSEQKVKEIQDEKKADKKLETAKQIVKDLNGAYNAAVKHERAKIQFFLEKIEEIQGGDINPRSGANT